MHNETCFGDILLKSICLSFNSLIQLRSLSSFSFYPLNNGIWVIYNHFFPGWLVGLQRTVENWLRKERDEDRKRRRERKENGLPEYDKPVEGSRVAGDPARSAVRVMNNGWAAGRLHSTIAGEENFFFSSNRVLRQWWYTCFFYAQLFKKWFIYYSFAIPSLGPKILAPRKSKWWPLYIQEICNPILKYLRCKVGKICLMHTWRCLEHQTRHFPGLLVASTLVVSCFYYCKMGHVPGIF